MIRASHVRGTALALALVVPGILGAQDFTWSGTVEPVRTLVIPR